MKCVFCDIVSGKSPAKILYQDDKVIAFDDLFPKTPQHKLIIPRKHIATLNDIQDEDQGLLEHMLLTAKKLATNLGIAEKGYRIAMNCNADGGQIIYHMHLHLMGGRALPW
jgi:histidine triad (HIT) family protein